MRPFFSVIIPLYNKGNFIKKTLQSVINQSLSDFEIIVVNDGSTDHGLQEVQKNKDERLVLILQENQGVSIARNQGIKKAQGNYIVLLDADDHWYPNHLAQLKKLILEFPKAGLYCSGYEIVLDDGLVQKARYSFDHKDCPRLIENYFLASLINPVAWTSAVAFSKEHFYKIGEYDPKLRTGQDIDFFIRAALKTQIAFDPTVSMRYHKHSENNLAKSHHNDDRIYLIHKFGEEEESNPSLKKYLDSNRYAVALRCKFRNDPKWKSITAEIDLKNLNSKQRFLLRIPKPLLQIALKSQQILMKFGIYLTAFR